MAIAFFSTWTTYGTWLPGDPRGWYQRGRGLREPDALRHFEAALRMAERALTLDAEQRRLVEKTIADHCAIRKWVLHSVNCRSNHVHVAVTAPGRKIEVPREQFKAWCTRRLKELEQARRSLVRENWWTERGWDEYIDDEDALADVNIYVLEGQGPG
jgi:REP element-mobilizing transposase RayT